MNRKPVEEEENGTFGGFSGKHDAVRSVKDGIGDITSLGTGRAGVDDHRLKHLRCSHDGFALGTKSAKDDEAAR